MSKSFEDLVAADVRNDVTPEEQEILKADVRRWLRVLNGLKRDVEIQMANQKTRNIQAQRDYNETKDTSAWLKFQQQEEYWRVGSLRFMASVEGRILYVKSLRAAEHSPPKAATATA